MSETSVQLYGIDYNQQCLRSSPISVHSLQRYFNRNSMIFQMISISKADNLQHTDDFLLSHDSVFFCNRGGIKRMIGLIIVVADVVVAAVVVVARQREAAADISNDRIGK